MRFFITGAAGFIGFHLARRLLADGHGVTGFDGLTAYYDVKLKQARLKLLGEMPEFSCVTALLEDGAALSEAVERAAPEVIVHLAAQAGVRYSLENPAGYLDANLRGSWNLLDIARRVKPKHLLIASTSAVYGASAALPFAETAAADRPLSLYAATKIGVEAMAHAYAHLYDIPTTVPRLFTVYGPWGRPDMAIFRFVELITANRLIDVYGFGTLQRDFTYVDDVVEALVRLIAVIPNETNRVDPSRAADTLSTQAPYRVVNVSGGRPVMLETLIQATERELGRSARRNLLPAQPGDVPATHADVALLQALTDYRPQTELDAGIRAFVAWYRAYTRAD